MRWFVIIIILLGSACHAQVLTGKKLKSYHRISRHSVTAPENYTYSTYHLSKYLTQNATTDLEKVRSFYVWIANNITYDMIGFRKKALPDDRPKAVLHNKLAVCDGYAQLFAELCKEAGIRAEVIRGFSKGYGYKAGQKFRMSNHAWNAVYLDRKWQLVDVTWAARKNNEDREIRPLLDQYFLVPPEKFVEDHLPEIAAWQLLSLPVTKNEFETAEVIIGKGSYSYEDTLASLLEEDPANRAITYQLQARKFNPENHEANYTLGLEYRYRGLDTLEAIYQVEEREMIKRFNILEQHAFEYFDEAALYFTLITPDSHYYESAQVFLDDTDFERGVFKYEVAHRMIELYLEFTQEKKATSRDVYEKTIMNYYSEAAVYFELIPRHSWYYSKAREYLTEYLKNPFEANTSLIR